LIAELRLFAQMKGVEPEVEEEVLKQKGRLQILHERGMLDEEKYAAKFYTISGKTDNDDAIIPGSSL
jgi:hypothetical protein